MTTGGGGPIYNRFALFVNVVCECVYVCVGFVLVNEDKYDSLIAYTG